MGRWIFFVIFKNKKTWKHSDKKTNELNELIPAPHPSKKKKSSLGESKNHIDQKIFNNKFRHWMTNLIT